MSASLRRPRRGRGRGSSGFRLRIGFLVIAAVISVFAGRLVQLQALDPHSYAAMAAAEGTVTASLPATRGKILDRTGEPLADSVDGLMIVADPQLSARQAPALATFLAHHLQLDYFSTLERLRATDANEDYTRFEYVARQVPASVATQVVDLARHRGFEGLDTRDDPIRTYPGEDVAASVVGFLGSPRDDGRAQPLAGMETTFDAQLAGRDGSARYQVGAGNRLPLGEATITDPVDGKDLHTTVDAGLQWFVQRTLRNAVVGAGAESGSAVVMDTATGEVLALADTPTYDASRPLAYDQQLYTPASVTAPFEPGSVEKVLTMAGLIDAGLVTDRTEITVPSVLNRQDATIHDYFEHGNLRLTLAGIVAKSSNIGTVLAADRYHRGQLRSYLTAFGLGRRVDMGVRGESPGVLPRGAAWTSQTEDRISFGQGLSVTALQMAAAVNSIANGGVRVDPSIVEGVARTDSGSLVGTDVATSRRVVSEEAARQTMLMMERVVDPEVGVAPLAQVPGYRVAGKTGTAQRAGGDCTCYDGSTTVSFGGFAPADAPRFTVYVDIQDPRAGSGGGSTAGPVFSRIMGFALSRYGVPPTGTRPSRLPVEW